MGYEINPVELHTLLVVMINKLILIIHHDE